MVHPAELVSVNVGAVREVRAGDRVVATAIWKAPVTGRVAISGVNLRGDDQADRSVHGGPDKAVYAYASEDHDWWAQQAPGEFGPGAFGENLTTRGVDVTGAVIGERWAVGSALLEVCQPRIPCFKLGLRHGDPRFPKRFAKARRPGAYLRILTEGDVAAGDRIEILDRPDHGVTIGDVNEAILGDHAGAADVAVATALPDGLRAWLLDRGA